MDTKRFNDEHAAKSRAVCERIEREDAERRGKLADPELETLKARIKRLEELLDARPAPADSWEQLEEDAEKIRLDIAHNLGDFSPSDFDDERDTVQFRVTDLIRRAKALAGVEVERDEGQVD